MKLPGLVAKDHLALQTTSVSMSEYDSTCSCLPCGQTRSCILPMSMNQPSQNFIKFQPFFRFRREIHHNSLQQKQSLHSFSAARFRSQTLHHRHAANSQPLGVLALALKVYPLHGYQIQCQFSFSSKPCHKFS